MECGDHNRAIQLFGHARTQMRHHTSRLLMAISLVGVLIDKLQCIEIAHRLTDIWVEI